MPPSLDTFDRIVCINLDDRPDRWEQTRQCITPLLGEKTLERGWWQWWTFEFI